MATRQKSIGVAYEDAAIIGGTVDNSPIGATTASTVAATTLSATGTATLAGNLALGTSAANTAGFYGATPATQRASSVQAASVVSAASFISVSTNLSIFAAEVAATLTGLGLWKGTA